MKKKRITFNTTLQGLYGKDNYYKHIEVDKCYWCFFGMCDNSKVKEVTGKNWNKIRITYVRSGVAFYVVCGYEDQIPEDSFYLQSIKAMQLEVAELDPYKDLPHFWVGSAEELLFRFDDDRTVVLNFDNENKEIEVPDNNIMYF